MLATLPLLASGPVEAQEAIDLSAIDVCRCELRPTEFARFGEADGPGMVEVELPHLAFDESGARALMFGIGTSRIAIFTADGEFVRAFGRAGEGPGDIGWITDAVFRPNGEVLVLDYKRGGLLRLSESGAELWSRRLTMTAGRLRELRGDTLVLARIDRSPKRVGFPLHLMTLNDTVVTSFGSDGEFSIIDPYGGAVLLGVSADESTVWWGSLSRFRFEEWDPSRQELRRRAMGAPAWWEPEDRFSDRPRYGVMAFAVDSNQRLWISTRIPDSDWRDVQKKGSEGIITRDQYDDYWDTRIDLYDLRTRTHLGSLVWDEATVRFQVRLGEVLASRLEYASGVTPQLVLYRLAPSGP